MDSFSNRDGVLYAEDVPLSEIAAQCGTPTYVYSRAELEQSYLSFDEALHPLMHQIFYAVKANGNLAVLQTLARLGAGFDIVSGGELARVLRAGGRPSRVVFSGVGKSETDIIQALVAGIGCFNAESEAELYRLNRLALAHRTRAAIALRVNPDVDARTHPYISTGLLENKFGIEYERAEGLFGQASELPGLQPIGLAFHIGSQLCELSPFVDALDRMLALLDRLATNGLSLRHIDVGGGLGVRYTNERPPSAQEWGSAIKSRVETRKVNIHCEPGRAIAANAGVLLTRVELLKSTSKKKFAVVDAAMNDLLRPSLYNAQHEITPVQSRLSKAKCRCDIVGPICESGDWLAKDRDLAIDEGDILAIGSAGAYGFVMSSNYNARPRAAEVMVDGSGFQLIRARETLEDLWRGETLLP